MFGIAQNQRAFSMLMKRTKEIGDELCIMFFLPPTSPTAVIMSLDRREGDVSIQCVLELIAEPRSNQSHIVQLSLAFISVPASVRLCFRLFLYLHQFKHAHITLASKYLLWTQP